MKEKACKENELNLERLKHGQFIVENDKKNNRHQQPHKTRS